MVLDGYVINMVMVLRGEYLAVNFDRSNKAMRHGAYTAYTLLMHGSLGAGNRRVIPSCVIWRIRREFPEATGQYKGFLPGRLV